MNRADEPAFPLPLGNENVQPECAGLTIRECFAALAMQGMIGKQHGHVDGQGDAERCALLSVKYADALLAELAKKPEGA